MRPVPGLTLAPVLIEDGRTTVRVKGELTEWAATPAWVPPMAETAHCRAYSDGATSTVKVYVGEVKPACAPPEMAVLLAIDNVIFKVL
jgi:hypothetical protein